MDLSIIIVNWNGRKILRDCLTSIYQLSHFIDFEVVVVDNASSDKSVEMLLRDFPMVKVVSNPKNLGFAAGNNRGFSLASGRYVLLLNSDTLVLAGTLEKSVKYMNAHPDIGVLGCRVEFPDRSFQTSCYRFSDPWVMFMARFLPLGSVANERLNIGRYMARQFDQPTDVDCVAGCFMMVRREVIDGCGNLDEDFFMYGEDEEWCDRIKHGGWRVIYFPEAIVIHVHRFSSRQARRVLRVIECMSPMLVLHKRRGHGVAWVGNLVMACALLVRMPAWMIIDIVQMFRGRGHQEMLQNRLVILMTHLNGVFKPVWLPSHPEAPADSKGQAVT